MASAKPDRRARTRGCLLGGAVGDALGAPIEFESLAAIRARFGPAGLRGYAPAYGGLGRVTDDTQMTLFTAEGLLRAHVRGSLRGVVDPVAVVHHAYMRWLRTQGRSAPATPEDAGWPDGWLVGRKALWSLRGPGTTCLGSLVATRAFGEPTPNASKGCGGVMRVAPVALAATALPAAADDAAAGAIFDLGAATARLTHGHPSGYLASGYFALVLGLVLAGRPLRVAAEDALARLAGEPGAETEAAVRHALALVDAAGPVAAETFAPLGAGWVAEEAVAIALYAALATPDFDAAVILAANHGGDSDSTASLAGQLVGAVEGEGAIAPRWLEPLELRDVVTQVADDLHALAGGTFDAEAEAARYPGW